MWKMVNSKPPATLRFDICKFSGGRSKGSKITVKVLSNAFYKVSRSKEISMNFLVEAVDSNGNSFLHFAAAKGHLERLVHLLNGGSNLNARNVFGWTPLMQAIRNGHTEAVKVLIGYGASLSIKNDYGISLLALAIASNNLQTIQLVLSLSDRIPWNNDPISPLSLAIIFNNRSVIHLLFNDLEAGLNIRDPFTEFTPASYAFLTKNFECLNMILKKNQANAQLGLKDSAIITQISNKNNILMSNSPKKCVRNSKFHSNMNTVVQKEFRLSDSKQIENWIKQVGGTTKGGNVHMSESVSKSWLDRHKIEDSDDDVFEEENGGSPTLISANDKMIINNQISEKQCLRKLLRTHSLDGYMSLFEKHDIDLDVMLTLSDKDLYEIGIDCPDKRRVFLELIFKLTYDSY